MADPGPVPALGRRIWLARWTRPGPGVVVEETPEAQRNRPSATNVARARVRQRIEDAIEDRALARELADW
ncbi:MAG: hypothetical protein OXI15_03125 [Chromatiales bacterium]|nr:hypothetical protein [Chromatiales bacterium]